MRFVRAIVCASVMAAFATSASAAPDNTLGMALMSATVNQSGTLLHGSGATASERESDGQYLVTFDRSMSGCSCVASAGMSMSGASHYGIMATANCPGDTANTVRVILRYHDGVTDGGSLYNGNFHTMAFCPK